MSSKQTEKKPKNRRSLTIAETADRHAYYEKAVQCVEAEIDIVDDIYRSIRGKRAKTLREDFCGTANTGCEWVRRRKTNSAIGLDLDQEVLDWGRSHNIARLGKDRKTRICLQNQDVMHANCPPADIILAMNFSYQLFKTRDALRQYFSTAREGLKDDGIFFLDAYGGYESYKTVKEKTKYDDFTYYWHQKKYNPINGHMLCHIHFKFKDGSRLKKAFTYDWRLWTLPELREILQEAGFSKVTVYWEGTDEETGDGDGNYSPTGQGEDDPSWVVYISAEK